MLFYCLCKKMTSKTLTCNSTNNSSVYGCPPFCAVTVFTRDRSSWSCWAFLASSLVLLSNSTCRFLHSRRISYTNVVNNYSVSRFLQIHPDFFPCTSQFKIKNYRFNTYDWQGNVKITKRQPSCINKKNDYPKEITLMHDLNNLLTLCWKVVG